jgi:nicotinate-nucleotide adenylyltransferase
MPCSGSVFDPFWNDDSPIGFLASQACAPELPELNVMSLKRNRRLQNDRVGVLGGTFNPIHFGHLHIAKSIQSLFSLSQVQFVVATTPPHKSLERIIPFNHRYAMVSLAVSGVPFFVPSMIELEPQASPFSVDTMSKLACSLTHEERKLYFIAGGDSLAEVKSWRESERLLTSYNFVFAMRPGIRLMDVAGSLPEMAAGRVRNFTGLGPIQIRRELANEHPKENRIYIVDVDAPDISATRIREMVSSGKSIRRMVPDPVGEYIRKLDLYGAR